MILINGILNSHISAYDRGLAYGDGVFRTLLVKDKRPLNWLRQYKKLSEDCSALGIACPPESLLVADIATLISGTPECVLKIIITRGESQRGYVIPEQIESNRILMTSPRHHFPDHFFSEGVKMHLCSTRLALQPILAGIKHLNRLENVLARQEWTSPEIAEGLLLDMEGNVIEGTMSNLFLLKGKTLHTPDLSRCGVAGVQRERIMEMAGQIGMTVRVANLPLARIYDADEVVLCNSVIGVWQVRELAEKKWPEGKLVQQLRNLLDDNNH